MKTPSFWNRKQGLSNWLLPLSFLYETGALFHRRISHPQKLSVPVICVGNVTAGGSGKTPVALAIGQRLKEKNIPAFFLSRGYGGSERETTRVDLKKHTATEVGDEPLLLAQLLPTIVSKDRWAGAQLAIKQGAQMIVMDDGFQNYALEKTLSLLVIDGSYGFGNGRLIPAGPLRELPENAFRRAHGIIVINRTQLAPTIPSDKPVLYAKTQPQDAALFKGNRYVAFCGIAHPQKFFESLSMAGAQVAEKITFGDHHAYNDNDLKKLQVAAQRHNAELVTTAKDAVKLPAAFRQQVKVLQLALEWDNPAMLDALLEYACKN